MNQGVLNPIGVGEKISEVKTWNDIDYYIWFKMTLDIDYYIWFKLTFDIYPKNLYVSHVLILVSQMTVQEPTQSWAVYCYFAVTCLLRAQKLWQAVVSCYCTYVGQPFNVWVRYSLEIVLVFIVI